MDNIIAEFASETQESLDDLDKALLMLEDFPDDDELLGKIFRNLHTIKGTCGFLGLTRLAHIAHTAETLLDIFRSHQRVASPADVALILKSIDTIRSLVDAVGQTGAEPAGDDSVLIRDLEAATHGGAAPAEPQPVPEQMPAASAAPQVKPLTAEDLTTPPAPVSAPVPATVPARAEEPATRSTGKEAQNNYLRVHVDTLENLMTRVSELVLMRNQLLQITRNSNEDALTERIERLNLIVSELQDGVMKTRMQPVGNAWSQLPRIVHDVARELGKKIHLEMSGEDTEIDRQVLDLIKDPLLHMARNAADHGIEMPADRLAAGKKETGTIHLSAAQEGGYIIIRLQDDGRGLNADKIRSAAVARGVMTAERAAAASKDEIYQCIFAPGFSTAESVTTVSGRGVGMDVVRTNIEKIGGTISLESRPGKGTTFTIRIPLTLAIIPALIVENSGMRYAIPQLNVQEVLHASPRGEFRIESVAGLPVVRLRGQVMPLVSLRNILTDEEAPVPQECHIIVTATGATAFGIIVDAIHDTEEIVVKPLSSLLRPLSVYGGNTILGDGSVILILDPGGLSRVAAIPQRQPQTAELGIEKETAEEDLVTLLVFTAYQKAPVAVPAFLVSHIHEFTLDETETIGDKMLLQHRGQLMPLHMLSPVPPEKTTLKTLVFTDDISGTSFGVVIDDVLDIVDSTLNIDATYARPGYLGAAAVKGTATDILDVNHFTGTSDWDLDKDNMKGGRRRILIVDDSAFFRHMLQPLLSMAGYAVTMVESPMSALALRDKGADFDLILSDIEMEGMSGFDFANKVKSEDGWRDIPMVAISSHATQKDIETGKNSGFSAYVPKSDKGALLSTLSEVFEKTRGNRQAT